MSDLPRAAVEAGAAWAFHHLDPEAEIVTWQHATPEAKDLARHVADAILAAAVRDENGEPCPLCEGLGQVPPNSWDYRNPMPCGFCDGSGRVWVLRNGEDES